jgi:hypothetical protein
MVDCSSFIPRILTGATMPTVADLHQRLEQGFKIDEEFNVFKEFTIKLTTRSRARRRIDDACESHRKFVVGTSGIGLQHSARQLALAIQSVLKLPAAPPYIGQVSETDFASYKRDDGFYKGIPQRFYNVNYLNDHQYFLEGGYAQRPVNFDIYGNMIPNQSNMRLNGGYGGLVSDGDYRLP